MRSAVLILFIFSGILPVKAQQLKPVDDKSEIKFTIKNFGINTSGSLGGLKGTIQFNATELPKSSFNVSADVSTINTGVDMRDNHLKKEEYFDASKYPSISFVSTGITARENGYTVTGRLTIKDVTKIISFPFTAAAQSDGILFTGSFSINRKDFHVGGSSGVLGSNVDVSLKVFAQK